MMCLAIFNTEVVHAVSDHYALNYHRIFSPTAHQAAIALIRGTYLRLTHTVQPFNPHLAGNELDGGDDTRHISCQRSLKGDTGECDPWFVLIFDSKMEAMVKRSALFNY